MTVAILDAPTQVLDTDNDLPAPPTDLERDLYLSSQHRWLIPATFVGYMLIVIGIAYFVVSNPWSALLIVPLFLSTLSTLLSLCTSVQRSRVSLSSHRRLVDGWNPAECPSVDIFLPSAGEPLEVLDNTFAWVQQVRWRGELTVYVLDDSDRPAVEAMARARGFEYLARPDRGHLKKAGNLRYGHGCSRGDLIAILDADFVPRSDFLDELVPYFDDPATGIVQSPQFFDVRAGMNWLQRAAGSTQILFYRYIQPARDVNDAAICVGTSAIYRRSSLDEGGGFAAIDHSEDMYTGVNLAQIGYQLRYVATVVTKGVCPDSFAGFITQQYRWCAGSMSLMLSRQFHAMKMTPTQRACYWAGFLYYVTTALDVLAIAIPSLLMLYFVADQVSTANYVYVLIALIVRQALIPFIAGNGDSLVNLARIQMTYSFAHLVQIFDQLRGHHDDGWVATGAATSSGRAERIIRTARVILIGTQSLMIAGLLWRVPQYGLDDYWAMIVFAAFNLYVTVPIMRADAHLPPSMQVIRNVAETGRPAVLAAQHALVIRRGEVAA
jgi:cellulose synthase (UDP-forming)